MEKIGQPKDPLKYMFKTEDDVFIRVESDKNSGLPWGTAMHGKTTQEMSKILSEKYRMEISLDDAKNKIKYIRK